MTGLVEAVRGKIDPACIETRKLKESGCMISMKGVPSQHLVIKFNKLRLPHEPDSKRCDYLFIANGDKGPCWVVLLELKRGKLSESEVIRQLQAGARIAENIVPLKIHVRFRPVAASKSRRKGERIKFRPNPASKSKSKGESSQIKFHKHIRPVKFINCGSELKDVLRQ